MEEEITKGQQAGHYPAEVMQGHGFFWPRGLPDKRQFAALKHITVILWLQIKVAMEALERSFGGTAA